MGASGKRQAAVMIQGTGSNVGKSVIVAGLARVFARRGLRVLPFKPQNMSNNAAVTAEGGEIGRAQALQAFGARVAPSIHMNPVLLKPESDSGSQIIVQGKRFGTLKAREFGKQKGTLFPYVQESFEHLERDADLILVEGAGSPAEINLRAGDIANMGFAEALDVPVILAGDIDRGGVIASVVGTSVVIEPSERRRIKAFFINKFRGDPSLFDSGLTEIENRSGWPSLGVVPWFQKAGDLPEEDALGLDDKRGQGKLKVVVPVISRIANFDDLDPLRLEEDVTLRLIYPGQALPGDADLVLLPGTKSTMGDLAFLRAQGWHIDIAAHVRRGGRVLGICGGYQMLGRAISDPNGIEGPAGTIDGLGLLDVETVLTAEKQVVAQTGTHLSSGEAVSGYEIHIGRTAGRDCARPFLILGGHEDGAQSADGQVAGTYLHGLFGSDGFRAAFLKGFGARSTLGYSAKVELAMEALADHLEEHLDCDRILEIARSRVG
ncbi:cobyric acid synthase [Pseudovibrio exalbescens]|uniref:cobyric acid synthase n=1 Tax=Pseudovibrio exalbescens TaxID=197461 RepID=UPI002366D246|nr:cobyric acid synthase [Pseudovibrio exalbescens]MDD7908455.1 cobyric acid synthase [Pseudovibrio exalbescens]